MRLAALRVGEVELTDAEKLVLQEARRMSQDGQKPTTRAVYDKLRGQIAKNQVEILLKRLRELGLLAAVKSQDSQDSKE